MHGNGNDVQAAPNQERSAVFPIISVVINLVMIVTFLVTVWALGTHYYNISQTLRPHVKALLVLIPLMGLPVLVFSTIVYDKFERERSRATAFVGMLLGLVGIPVYLLLPFYPGLYADREPQAYCMSQMKQISMALILYSEEHANNLPPQKGWNEALAPYLLPKGYQDSRHLQKMLHCYEEPNTDLPCYALNKHLIGRTLKSLKFASEIPMVFESVPGRNQCGDQSILPKTPRHNGGYVVGFADGHAGWKSAKDIRKLRWKP